MFFRKRAMLSDEQDSFGRSVMSVFIVTAERHCFHKRDDGLGIRRTAFGIVAESLECPNNLS